MSNSTLRAQRIIASSLLLLDLLISAAFSFMSGLNAQNDYQWIIGGIVPSALLPVTYFLVVFGIASKDADQSSLGILAAITIVAANGLILTGYIYLGSNGYFIESLNSAYILLGIFALVQILLAVFFQNRMRYKNLINS